MPQTLVQAPRIASIAAGAQHVEPEPAGEIESVQVEPVEEVGGFAPGVLEAIEADAQEPVAPVTKAKPAKAAPVVIKPAPKTAEALARAA